MYSKVDSNNHQGFRKSVIVLLFLLTLSTFSGVFSFSVYGAKHGQSDIQTAKLIGTTTLGGTRSALLTDQASSSPVSSKEYSRPTQNNENTANIPTVSSAAVVGGDGGATSAKGLNAFDSGQSNIISGFGPLDVEPPDQGLCVGNGFVVEAVNLALRVYTTSFSPVTGPMPLAGLVGFPIAQQFGVSPVGGGYILSDPRCLFDTATHRWFISFLYFGGNNVFSSGGPFPLGPNTYGAEFVFASTTNSPTGSFHMYMFNVTSDLLAGNCPCFGDQPLLGADANTIVISTNEFSVFAATNFFNGAQVYLLDKNGMAAGNPVVNVDHFNIGLTFSPPEGGCAATGGLDCFYSVNPGVSPTSGSYDSSNGGTAWALSSLDFTGNGDNRIAVWSFADTSSISTSPAITASLNLLTNLETYRSFGQLVSQANGPIPLGKLVYSNTGRGGIGCVGSCKVGDLASNGDGLQGAVSYAQGALWGAVDTVVNTGSSNSAQNMGVAFWVINAAGSTVSLANQGYIVASSDQLTFPSIAVGPTGNALATFTLTGQNQFPSTAFAWISKTSSGPISGTIFVSAPGKSPQDGFSEYQLIQFNGAYRPRWGDYTFAIWSGGKVYFSTEYIQSPNCSNAAFIADSTCGGTRDTFANWGTSLNSVST